MFEKDVKNHYENEIIMENKMLWKSIIPLIISLYCPLMQAGQKSFNFQTYKKLLS